MVRNLSFFSFSTCISWLKVPPADCSAKLLFCWEPLPRHTNTFSTQKWKLLQSFACACRTACACSAHPSLSSTPSLFRFNHWPCFCIHSSLCSLSPLVPWAIYSFDAGKHHTVLHKWNQVSPAAFWSCWFLLHLGQAIPAAFVFLPLLAAGLQSAGMPSVISWNQNCMKCWAKRHFHTSLDIC